MVSTRRRFLQIGAAISFVGVAGCLGQGQGTDTRLQDDNTGVSAGSRDIHASLDRSEDSGDSGTYNEADVMFLRMMIPHHEGAIEMAQLVPERTDRQELIELAKQIITTQRAEIEQMRMMLKEAGESPDESMDMRMDMRSGSMDPKQMETLRSLRGCEFDLMFIKMMIEHHRGAITMAKDVLENGRSPKVEQLARNIIQAQRAEIKQMSEWYQEWST
jgi:uncharacterized protein (DUF305 family)